MNMENYEFHDVFVSCYERYFNSVVRYVRGFVYNEFVSEEIAQEVFLKAFEKADRGEVVLFPSKLRNFIFKIARNKAFDFLKREKIEYAKLLEVHYEEALLDGELFRSLEDFYIEGQVISTMNETIHSFPDDKKRIFIDMVIHGKNLKALSGEYELSVYRLKKIRDEIMRKIRDNVHPIIEVKE